MNAIDFQVLVIIASVLAWRKARFLYKLPPKTKGILYISLGSEESKIHSDALFGIY